MVSCNLDGQKLYSFMRCVGRVCKEGGICNYAARVWGRGASEEHEMQLLGFPLRSYASGFPLFPFLEPSKLLWRPGQRRISRRGRGTMIPASEHF